MSATGELRRPEAAEVPPGWSELLRTAYLLTADHGAAEDLAVAALVRARRRRWWGRPAPDPRRLVLTLPASPALRTASTALRPGEDHGDPLLRAYRSLPQRRRALLVLRVADHVDEQAAAAAVGVPAQRARTETVTALDALRAPLADRAGGVTVDAARAGAPIELDLGEMSDVPRPTASGTTGLDAADPVVRALGRLFADLEAQPPVTAHPDDRVARASARDRVRRRTMAVVAAALVLLVAAGGGLAVRQHARDEAARERAAREQALEALLHPLVLGSDVSTWPTRGSHAGDAALLAQVRRRVGAGVALPFVGRVGDLDMALAYTGTLDNPRLFVLHGPAGTAPDRWAEDDGVPVAADAAVLSAAIRDDAGLVHLVVVTLSRGVSAAWSSAARIGDDATVSREYRAFRLDDGIGTAVTRGEPRRFALRLQYATNTAIQAFDVGASDVTPPDRSAGPLPVAVRTASSCAGLAVAGDTRGLVERALDQAGLAAAEVTGVRQLWCRGTGDRSGIGLAVTATHGPDMQCFEGAFRSEDGLIFERHCWPVPRGRGASAPFVAPSASDRDVSGRHDITVWAPGGRLLEVKSTIQGHAALARAAFTAEGLGHVVVDWDGGPPPDSLIVVVRDGGGRATALLPLQFVLERDGWDDMVDGPVLAAPG